MDGSVTETRTVAFNSRTRSVITQIFNLDLGKIAALQTRRVIPLEAGPRAGSELARRHRLRSTSGTIGPRSPPLRGPTQQLDRGQRCRRSCGGERPFYIDQARLTTASSELNAPAGSTLERQLRLKRCPPLQRGGEILNIVRVTGLAPETNRSLTRWRGRSPANRTFDGNLRKSTDPTIDGRASLASVSLRGRDLGTLT